MKTCSGCRISKRTGAFNKCRADKSGLHSYCKKCAKSADRKRYWKNPDKARKIKRKEYQTSPKVRETARWNSIKKFYGITRDDFEALLKKQKGACAICGLRPKDNLSVDHNHSTGTVRGLLCMACNLGLGQFKESKALLAKAHTYLNSHEK